jgi:hypothetical protein
VTLDLSWFHQGRDYVVRVFGLANSFVLVFFLREKVGFPGSLGDPYLVVPDTLTERTMDGELAKAATGDLSAYRKVDNDANFQRTKTHVEGFRFSFPRARALGNVPTFFLENAVTFVNGNVEQAFF